MKNINLGKVKVPLDQYASQGNAVLGIRGSGKTYTATGIAEQLLDGGVPITVLDPVGVWRFLRVPSKEGGKAYPVVVAGGQHADIPLPVHGAGEIMRAAMRDGVSIVFDLYDVGLSKADWRRVVSAVVKVLLYENKEFGLRHVFIEEAAEFVPQKVSDGFGEVYSIVERLARMGGNAQLGLTLINQRAEEVNKAVLELCDLLLLHRQKGRRSLENLSHWLDLAAGPIAKDVAATVPGLANGECYVWPEGAGSPTRSLIPTKHTFHPDRRAMKQAVIAEARRVDVGKFAESMKDKLAAIIKEAEANDPAKMKAEIRRLTAELAKKPAAATPVKGKPSGPRPEDTAAIKALRKALETAMKFIIEITAKGFDGKVDAEALQKALAGAAQTAAAAVERHIDQRNRDFARLRDHGEKVVKGLQALLEKDVVVQLDVKHNEAFTVTPAAQRPARHPAKLDHTNPELMALAAAQRKILNALAFLEQVGITPADRTQVSLFADLSPTAGHTNNMFGGLRTAALIEYPTNWQVILTDAGRNLADPGRVPQTAQEMQAILLAKVAAAQRKILAVLIEAYPEVLDRHEASTRAGLSPDAGHTNNMYGGLRSMGLIDYPQQGKVVARPVLFLER